MKIDPMWHPARSRKILKRIVVEGTLKLLTPASFSNGDQGDLVDITLLVDACDGRSPLLTGASLAGALRSYLFSYEQQNAGPRYARILFGGEQSDERGDQSPLVLDDCRGKYFAIEVRDGVRIAPQSRTAQEGMLYNREVWSVGTTFDLSLELLVCEKSEKHQSYAPESELRQALATALAGINSGAITFGGRKTRGYGRAKVENWTVKTYDMTVAHDLKAWIHQQADPQPQPTSVIPSKDISIALGVSSLLEDKRSYFEIEASFALESSLLIRTEGVGKYDPDMVHLGNNKNQPLLSGTSLAGALRARAAKIAKTLKTEGEQIAEQMFGADMDAMRKRNVQKPAGQKERPYGSRIRVTEQVIQNPAPRLVQNRVSIDRFTGGALETALFNEEPVFSQPDKEGADGTRVVFTIGLKNPKDHEIGLLLHLLKDLWTQDLPLGGESSVGRGRLRGIEAHLKHHEKSRNWHILETKDALTVTGNTREELETYAVAFHAWNPVSDQQTELKLKEASTDGK